MEKLTRKKALGIVKFIENYSDDPERAHTLEDRLFTDFIHCVANNMYDDINEASNVAEVVSRTSKIDFPRWCA